MLKRLENVRRKNEKKDKPLEVQKSNKKSKTKKVRRKVILVSEDDSSESDDVTERAVYKKKSLSLKTILANLMT
jgi:hypothetical protein